MIDTRENAYAERLPRADALLARDGAADLVRRRKSSMPGYSEAARNSDVAALGTAEQRDQWERVSAPRTRSPLEAAGPDREELANACG